MGKEEASADHFVCLKLANFSVPDVPKSNAHLASFPPPSLMKLLVPFSPRWGALLLALALPLLLAGLAALLAALVIALGEWFFLRHAEGTAGTVDHFESHASASGSHQTIYYKPAVVFTAHTGQKYTFTADEESQDRPAYAVGQDVPVLYDPANPSRAELDTFSTAWGTTLFCAGAGVVLTAAGAWLLAGRARGLRRNAPMPALAPLETSVLRDPAIPFDPPVTSGRRLQYPKTVLSFRLLSVAMLLGAVWTGAREELYLAGARHTQGKVVSVKSYLQRRTGSRGYMKYRPSLSFEDEAGKTWTFDSGSYGLEGGKVGAVLPVVYDPSYPEKAQLDSFWGEWDPTFTFAYVGAFALLLSWVFQQATTTAAPRDPAILAGP